ncbi:MAG: transcription termination/antitermination protein NusG [Eubacterium sp.]|nr:transcription termination/antitermination factor NusG [Eubacterium sp.]MCR4846326.1 transcription termination/antitermination protein NusG [Eubacterium sp.]
MADEKSLDMEETSEVSEEIEKTEEQVEETAAAEETVQKSANIKQQGDNEPHWYVVHTYSGYEEKVKKDILKTIENRRLQDQMFEVMVPLQDVTEVRKGVKKTVSKKIFPGYVLVHMIKNDVTWYVVRNTRGVTGFVGPGSEPVPLTDAEMIRLGVRNADIEIDVEVGDAIKVIAGAWEGTVGNIKTISKTKQSVTIDIDIFGRSTDVEISLGDIQKL